MPADLAKTILHQWQKNQLATETGLQQLLEAAMTVDPEKTITSMEELGLTELTLLLKETTKM
jgi:hypothetical protein